MRKDTIKEHEIFFFVHHHHLPRLLNNAEGEWGTWKTGWCMNSTLTIRLYHKYVNCNNNAWPNENRKDFFFLIFHIIQFNTLLHITHQICIVCRVTKYSSSCVYLKSAIEKKIHHSCFCYVCNIIIISAVLSLIMPMARLIFTGYLQWISKTYCVSKSNGFSDMNLAVEWFE